jgi:hypothetical protein
MEKNLKISINGREYPSLEAMPPADRALYDKLNGLMVDKDGDGMPDIFQALQAGDATGTTALRELLEGMPDGGLRMQTSSTTQSIFDTTATMQEPGTAAAPAIGTTASNASTASPARPAPMQAGNTVVRAEGAGGTRLLVVVLVVAIAAVAWWFLH